MTTPTTSTTKCENCGAVIYPEESEYVESKELELGDGIVCDRCASKLRREEKK